MKQRFAFSNDLQQLCIKFPPIIINLLKNGIHHFNDCYDFNINNMNVGLVSSFYGHKIVVSSSRLYNKYSFIKK